MCLSIPAEIISINGDEAEVSVNGNRLKISLMVLKNVKVGDFILIHSGFAIEIIDREEAEKTIEIVRLMKAGNN
ncbi:MAG: HypC/HybG/HupF family hydrogenase formation chaperone [Bacteroides sp.]|jgi:hydrogenase expression/formation protein HypC|nr:HypC/HybG/HupF family hydrogenase formation chaperone [Bacteroides sp.]